MKKINSGINLFKLFSMFMIAQLHILGMGGIIGATAGTAGYYHAFFMQNAAFCAVNCYALASGYLIQRCYLRNYDERLPRPFLRAEDSPCPDSDNFKSVLVYDLVFSDVSVYSDDE